MSSSSEPGERLKRSGYAAERGRKIKDEIKSKDQIRKDREKKAQLKEKNLPKAVRRLKEAKAKAGTSSLLSCARAHII